MALLVLVLEPSGENQVTGALAHSLPEGEQAGSFRKERVRARNLASSRLLFAHPLGGGLCTCFCSLLRSDRRFWSFLYLVQNCPNCACTQLLLILIVSLCFVAQGKVCLGASTTALVPGFRPQTVTSPLWLIFPTMLLQIQNRNLYFKKISKDK